MKKGFTLAEVLITLAVIGIVAALTIPTVTYNYQKKAQYTAFMKEYNTISEVANMAAGEESPSTWDYEGDLNDFIDEHLIPYLKVTGRGEIDDYFSATTPVKMLNGSDFMTISDLCGVFDCSDAFMLQDGSTFLVYTGAHSSANNKYVAITFDTNGLKGPNILGRDMFYLEMGYYTENGIQKPYVGLLNEPLEGSCDPNGQDYISGSPQGVGCPDKLLKEGKMGY